MIIQAATKYNFGDKVAVMFNKTRPGLLSEGIIEAVRLYQSQHMDQPMIVYIISPAEMVGFEHDSEESILEQSIQGKI